MLPARNDKWLKAAAHDRIGVVLSEAIEFLYLVAVGPSACLSFHRILVSRSFSVLLTGKA